MSEKGLKSAPTTHGAIGCVSSGTISEQDVKLLARVVDVLPTIENNRTADLIVQLSLALVNSAEELGILREMRSCALAHSYEQHVEVLRVRRRLADLFAERQNERQKQPQPQVAAGTVPGTGTGTVQLIGKAQARVPAPARGQSQSQAQSQREQQQQGQGQRQRQGKGEDQREGQTSSQAQGQTQNRRIPTTGIGVR